MRRVIALGDVEKGGKYHNWGSEVESINRNKMKRVNCDVRNEKYDLGR